MKSAIVLPEPGVAIILHEKQGVHPSVILSVDRSIIGRISRPFNSSVHPSTTQDEFNPSVTVMQNDI